MEILIGLAIILAFNEWRDVKGKSRFNELKREIEEMKIRQEALFLIAKSFEDMQVSLKNINSELEENKEFINKAHTDLETIVKEYEINGIPLNLRRGQNFDMVEGL